LDQNILAIHLEYADIGSALRAGYSSSNKKFVVQFSADWVDFNFIERAYKFLETTDIVCGCKAGPQEDDNRPIIRRIGSRLFQSIENCLFKLPISDTHGIKIARSSVAREVALACRFGQEAFETEFIVRASGMGYSVRGIPVPVDEVRPPRISMLKRAPRALMLLSRLWVVYRTERLFGRFRRTLHPTDRPSTGEY
jgi:hypothetical protein